MYVCVVFAPSYYYSLIFYSTSVRHLSHLFIANESDRGMGRALLVPRMYADEREQQQFDTAHYTDCQYTQEDIRKYSLLTILVRVLVLSTWYSV